MPNASFFLCSCSFLYINFSFDCLNSVYTPELTFDKYLPGIVPCPLQCLSLFWAMFLRLIFIMQYKIIFHSMLHCLLLAAHIIYANCKDLRNLSKPFYYCLTSIPVLSLVHTAMYVYNTTLDVQHSPLLILIMQLLTCIY